MLRYKNVESSGSIWIRGVMNAIVELQEVPEEWGNKCGGKYR